MFLVRMITMIMWTNERKRYISYKYKTPMCLRSRPKRGTLKDSNESSLMAQYLWNPIYDYTL